jgi:hypothetical protein
VGKHIVLSVVVNDSLEVDMILDTGLGFLNGALLLDPELGSALGLEYLGQVPLGGGGAEKPRVADVSAGARLSLPGVEFSEQQLLVVRDREPFSEWPVRGIIGRTLFDCVVEVDYDRLTINLYDRATFQFDECGEELSVTFTYGIPVVEGTVGIEGGEDIPVKLIVDTGAEELLLFAHSDKRIAPPETVIEGTHGMLSEGMLGDISGVTGRISRLNFGNFAFEEIVTSFPDSASWGPAILLGQNGMIGNDILQKFTVIFDYDGERIFLQSGEKYTETFEANMAGLLYVTRPDHKLRVYEVIQGSPASESGIEKEDLIVEVNGREIGKFENAQLLKLFLQEGASVTLTVERDSQRFTRTLVLRRLI